MPVGAELPKLARHVCANGLSVVVAPNHATPIVTIEIALRGGALAEGPETSGYSRLFEFLFFTANRALADQDAYAARLRQLGMQSGAYTDSERVYFHTSTTPAHLAGALAVMRDALVSPLVDARRLDWARGRVRARLDHRDMSPRDRFAAELRRRVWWRHPTRKDPWGTREGVRDATVKRLQAFLVRYYVPNNAVLVVAGDVDAEPVFALAERLFERWVPAADPFAAEPMVQHPPLVRSEVLLVTQPVETVHLSLVWHGPSTRGPGTDLSYPADVLSMAARQGQGRLKRTLLDSGACLAAQLDWYTQVNTGPITLALEARPDRADACLDAALAEIGRLSEPGYLQDGDVASAVQAIEAERSGLRDHGLRLAHTLTFWWASAGFEYADTYSAKLAQVTAADVTRFAQTYLRGRPFVLGVMLAPAMLQEHGLDAAHFEARLALPAAAAAPTVPAAGPMPSRPLPPPAVPRGAVPPAVVTATAGDVTAMNMNDLEILVRRMAGAERVSANLYVEGGALNWGREDAGIEQLAVASAATGGSEELAAAELAQRLSAIDSSLRGTGNDNWSSLRSTSPKIHWPEALALLAAAFLRPALPPQAIERERNAMLSALLGEGAAGSLSEAVRELVPAGHPLSNPSRGTPETLARLTREDLTRHLAGLRDSRRLLLVVVGDVDPIDVWERTRAALGGLTAGTYEATPPPPLRFTQPRLVLRARTSERANQACSTAALPIWGSPDYAAALVTVRLLGKDVLSAGSALAGGTDAPLVCFCTGGPEVAKGMKGLYERIRGLARKPIPERELAGVKEQFLTGYLQLGQTPEAQADLLARAHILAGDFRAAARLPEAVRAVTPAAVQAFARDYLRNFQSVLQADPATLKKGLPASP
jgi:zinc protease